MGICQEAHENPAVVEFIVATGTSLHDGLGAEQGITQMHGVHSDTERQKSCSHLQEWMRGDEECREWIDENASAESNAILRHMTAAANEKAQILKEKEQKEKERAEKQ